MTSHAARIAREDTVRDALRAVAEVVGDEEPTDQALRIVAALKLLRSERPPARVASLSRVDYLSRAQEAARAAWLKDHAATAEGPEHTATGGTDTPIGRLTMTTWRRAWKGDKHGQRTAWAGEYYLDGEPITIAEIRAAGLAQRPTTRNRQRPAEDS